MRISRRWVLLFTAVLTLAAVIAAIWRDDILEALLDPRVPYAVYKPPRSPDYASRAAWALYPSPSETTGPVDVFFVHPTTFNGGHDWNGAVNDGHARNELRRVIIPNYVGPFESLGPVYAPLYRQASLYTSMTLFDDAIEAREFAYQDILASFRLFQASRGRSRPFMLVGVEQGGSLAARLLKEEIERDRIGASQLVAAYLIETVAPADEFTPSASMPACTRPDETGCVLAWVSVDALDMVRVARITSRGRIWNDAGHLVSLGGRAPLCVNPILGRVTEELAPSRLNLGAANATGLEWGLRPGFMARQVSARCVDGLLRVGRPRSRSLRPAGSWADRLKAAPYNLFWADIEADAARRSARWLADHPPQPASVVSPSARQSNKARST